MKGQISIIESILAITVLLIAFNMMITTGEYQTKWEESLSSLNGRDILVTGDRSGKLHDYSFSPADFKSEFLDKIEAIKDIIIKVETQGAVSNTVYVACDCTSDQITYLQNILTDVKLNTRAVNAIVCSTELPMIETCGASTRYPDALVIWGDEFRELAPYINILLDFVSDGNGLVEITDVPNSKVDGGADDDEGQKRIFGLKSIAGIFPRPSQDEFLKPRNSSQLSYQSYKWFYHLPYLLKGTVSEAVPTEGGIPPCATSGMRGEFKFQKNPNKFWICGTASVYWDADGNNKADTIATTRNKFSIETSNFFLNYIDSTDKIRISFKLDYQFDDFVRRGEAHNKLAPIDNDKNKVLLSMGFWDAQREKPIAAIIFNGTESGKTAWVADFARNAKDLDKLNKLGDDYEQLLASMVLSVSNKKTREAFQQTGQITSYINVNNTDMLEIYKIELSIGKPF